jgi:hypothetical protein
MRLFYPYQLNKITKWQVWRVNISPQVPNPRSNVEWFKRRMAVKAGENVRYLDTNQVDAGILVKNQTKAAPFMFLTATTAQSTPPLLLPALYALTLPSFCPLPSVTP